MVSVCMITYGHEKYIKEAIESILMQECNFDVELIISNDVSPDNTDQIIQGIMDNHPKAFWIKYTKHQKNIGMMPNFLYALKQCRGKYIALCEGDDYWTDSLKLQKQVDYLDNHSECSLTIHNVAKMDFDGTTKILNGIESNQIIDFKRLIKFDFAIPTCSWVFRNNFEFSNWILQCGVGDWPLLFLLLKDSYCYYFADILGVYRKHIGGVSNKINSSNYYLVHIQALELFNKYERHHKKREINQGLSLLYLRAYIYERINNNFKIYYLLRSFYFNPSTFVLTRKKTALYWTLPIKLRNIIR